MYEYIYLGSSPAGEDCVQVRRDEDYMPAMRAELKRYKEYLEGLFPIPDELVGLVYFKVRWESHDFGSYGEVCVYYDPESEEAAKFAYNVEKNTPEYWEASEGTLRQRFALRNEEE